MRLGSLAETRARLAGSEPYESLKAAAAAEEGSATFLARNRFAVFLEVETPLLDGSLPGMDRPQQPELARLYDDAISAGHEVRYASDERLVVYIENRWGCAGILLLVGLGLLTAFIVPLILLVLGMLAPGGRVITYELRPNGKVKRSWTTARR